MSRARNLAASVDHQLRNLAQENSRPIADVRIRYVLERFLYRLSLSQYRDEYVLKGAFVLQALTEPSFRQTRDIDLHSRLHAESQQVQGHIQAILDQDTSDSPDGLQFIQDSVRMRHFRLGYRLGLDALMGSSRYTVRVDIAYDDRAVPPPVMQAFPSLLDLPGPTLLCYRPETSIAEKFHVMVDLGDLNSRMKDYYGIWYMSRLLPVSGHDLTEALKAVFAHRNTPLPSVLPVGLSDAFAVCKQSFWETFRNHLHGERGPKEFVCLTRRLQSLLMPLLYALESGLAVQDQWDASRGHWASSHPMHPSPTEKV